MLELELVLGHQCGRSQSSHRNQRHEDPSSVRSRRGSQAGREAFKDRGDRQRRSCSCQLWGAVQGHAAVSPLIEKCVFQELEN